MHILIPTLTLNSKEKREIQNMIVQKYDKEIRKYKPKDVNRLA